MKRLTDEHWRNLDPWECCGQDKYCNRGCHDEGGCVNGCIVPKLYVRLAAYEDTGLEAEEAKRVHETLLTVQKKQAIMWDDLQKYLQAEAEGRLLVLPCKVGDVLWNTESRTESPSSHIVLGFDVLKSLNMVHLSGGKSLPVSEIGKTIFLTREEAEAALKAKEE